MQFYRVWTSASWERLLVGDLFNKGVVGGLLLTLILGLAAIVISTVLGTGLGLMRASRSRVLRAVSWGYVQVFRSVPLLILIFWAYFVPPVIGFELTKFESVLIALIVFTTAYIGEVVHGGILSISSGQIEAARALGMSPSEIRYRIVVPQAFFSMLPALTGRYIVTIKNTSLAFLIGLSDLTEIGRQIGARVMSAPVEVYLTLLIVYFLVNRTVSALMLTLENRALFNRLFVRV